MLFDEDLRGFHSFPRWLQLTIIGFILAGWGAGLALICIILWR